MNAIHILVIDDQYGRSENFRAGFLESAKKGVSPFEYGVEFHFHSGQDGGKNSLRAVEEAVRNGWPFENGNRWAVLLLDVRFDQVIPKPEDENFGFEVLRHLRRVFGPDLPIVMLTSEDEIKRQKANREAANGFLSKNQLSCETLELAICKSGLIPDLRATPQRLIGCSLPLLKVLREARNFALHPVGGRIIYGETGSGKTELARFIHDHSARQGVFRSWTVVQHGDPSLIQDKLFGHWKNAYNGANGSQAGEIERAHFGTFLLDEIADLSQDGQQLLIELRRRDELGLRTVTRLGTFPRVQSDIVEARGSVVGFIQDDHKVKVDVLFLSATNKNLRDRTFRESIGFREDLYNDLGQPIDFPSLNDRVQDIPSIFEGFVAALSPARKPIVSQEVIDLLSIQNWTDKNITHLKSVAEAAVAAVGDFDEILPRHLPEEIVAKSTSKASSKETLEFSNSLKTLHLRLELPSGIDFSQMGSYSHYLITHYETSLKLLERTLWDRREPSGEFSPVAAVGYMLHKRVSTTVAKRVIKEIIGSILSPGELYGNILFDIGLGWLQEYVNNKSLLMAFYKYSNGEITLKELNSSSYEIAKSHNQGY